MTERLECVNLFLTRALRTLDGTASMTPPPFPSASAPDAIPATIPARPTPRELSPNRSDGLRVESRRRLLAHLRAGGPCAQAGLGPAVSLSGAAVSRLAAELVSQGLIVSTRASATRPGRPSPMLSLNGAAGCVVTVSIAIDRLDARCVDFAGAPVASASSRPRTRELDGPRLVAEVAALVGRVRGARLRGIGIGVQGITANAGSTLVWSPVLPATEVELGAEIAATFGVPATVENDCRAIARALHAAHREALGDSFATVLFSRGVGLALHLDGAQLAGVHSSALEFGHLRHRPDGARCRCGRLGCIEAYAADYAIARTARGASAAAVPAGRIGRARMRAIAAAAAKGAPDALRAFAEAGTALGEGLRQLYTLLDPMPVALVGRDEATLAHMRPALRAALSDARGPRTLGAAVRDEAAELHRFDDPEPLLQDGLGIAALDALDRELATRIGYLDA